MPFSSLLFLCLVGCAMRPADGAGSSRAQASTSSSRLGPSASTVQSLQSQEIGAPSDPRSAGSPVPPSPAGSVASGCVGASAAAVPRSAPGQSGTPSESSAVTRQAQLGGDDEGGEIWPDSEPESFWGDRQNLQDVFAFLDQKELEMNLVFAKMRAQLLQAIPTSSVAFGKQAIASRSDEVTTGWREFGGPFYRALALQREREKENQHLRDLVANLNKLVARRRAELEQLQEKLDQIGTPVQPSLAAFSFSNLETSPLAGAVAATPPSHATSHTGGPQGQGLQASHAQVQSDSFGRQALLQAEAKAAPQLPLPNTPHFPAAPSPRNASPSPLDLGEGDPELQGQQGRGVGAFGSPLDDALKQNVSSFASKVVDVAVPKPPAMQRSESATSSVSLSQMYKNPEGQQGQGSTQRK